jgi:hypothetical protein
MQKAMSERTQDFLAVGLPGDASTLPFQSDVEITRQGKQREGRKVDVDSARRVDAFTALRKGLAQGCYDAARRFELDLLNRLGLSERMAGTGRVDCTAGHTTDLMRTAGIMVDKVQDRISPRDFWLLCELIAPAIDRGTWRDHTAYVTGEDHTEGQAAAVRASVVNLRDAYTSIEREGAAHRLTKAFGGQRAA